MNTAGPRKVTKQTMAVGIQADRVIFRHCQLLSHQDTLLAGSGRQYFCDCKIVGDSDFIFGDATAVFDRCEIQSVNSGTITAQERTTPDSSTGFVFNQCKFTSTPNVRPHSICVGRPFRAYARVVLLNCELGDHIDPAAWSRLSIGDFTKTAWFAELQSTGDGATIPQRVAWSRQLNAEQAAPFAPSVFLQGSDHWQPSEKSAGATQP